MPALTQIFQQAHTQVDNQQVKDNIQRETALQKVVTDIEKKERESKTEQENKEKAGQAIPSTSKG